MALPVAARAAIDPDGAFALIRDRVLAYVQDELIAGEMNVFDAALALIALGHLGAEVASFAPALHCIVRQLGEGGRHGPFKAYEWNKMKTPTRILVGGPEVTSAFVLMGLSLARKAMRRAGRIRRSSPSPRVRGDGWGEGLAIQFRISPGPVVRTIRRLPASGTR